MQKLEHEALAEEGHNCQAFMEATGTTLWDCPFKAHGVLMCPLQLLTGNVPLATMLATTLNWLQWAENHHQQPCYLQCQGCQHTPLELNDSATHLTRKQ